MQYQKGFIARGFIFIIAFLIIGGGIYVYQNKGGTSVETGTEIISTTTETIVQTSRQNDPVIKKTQQSTVGISKGVVYDQTKIEACVTTYKAEQDKYDNQISSGYIVVGFTSTTTLVLAKDIIKSHGLIPRETTVGYHSKLYADVKQGEEFLWSCRLKQDSRIRYADPSPTYSVGI